MRIATLLSCALLTSGVSAHAQSYDWSGAYVGASVGAAWVDTGVSTELTNFWNVPSEQVDRDALLPLLNGGLNGENVFGGVALGYNLQQSDLVYGVEADVSFLNVDDSRTGFNVPGLPVPQPYRIDTAARFAAVLAGRSIAASSMSPEALPLADMNFRRTSHS
ncbi:outer membrane beta-barrel protein [Hyphomicrobium sp. D-2]|uniref:outer membrane protein n=1 Tax=Hyphomicrobium sp. D-2 TaxID=3041621 RepID=UPI0024588768|nr:outer membrane beta-barrel protein [Hyphomicrobium sp. D-2]MDH4983852.1 outer membrane beta-barrel protein [Hyphomicrobium sp. D-2]